MEFRIAECIREALFEELWEEIPYACYVEVDNIENSSNAPLGRGDTGGKPRAPLLKAQAYIYTETESQKKVVIGKWGQKIQALGTQARVNLETIFGKKVFLSLRVKVEKNWRKNTKILDKIFPKK
jgi:GTP-binding protein Era